MKSTNLRKIEITGQSPSHLPMSSPLSNGSWFKKTLLHRGHACWMLDIHRMTNIVIVLTNQIRSEWNILSLSY